MLSTLLHGVLCRIGERICSLHMLRVLEVSLEWQPMVAVEERDNLKSYVEILKSRNLKNRILKSYVYIHDWTNLKKSEF